MRNTNAPSTAGQLRLKNNPAFSVVLAYDKYADGIRAKEFFDGLVINHGELFHFICHLWKVDVLREPQLFEIATRDALGADMIVFAIRQSQELPVEARRWIAYWLPSKQAGSGALTPGRRHHDRACDLETNGRKRQSTSFLEGDCLAGGGLAFSRANHEPSFGRNRGTAQRPAEKGANPVINKGMIYVTKR